MALGADDSWNVFPGDPPRKTTIDLKEVYEMGKSVLLAASAVVVTLALPQAASAVTVNGATLKSAIATTANVEEAGYYYRRRYYYRPYYRPYYYGYGY